MNLNFLAGSPKILGHPALLWSLERPDGSQMECVGGNIADGRFCVRVLRDRHEHDTRVFDTALEAIRWASELEIAFLEDGWTRTLS